MDISRYPLPEKKVGLIFSMVYAPSDLGPHDLGVHEPAIGIGRLSSAASLVAEPMARMATYC